MGGLFQKALAFSDRARQAIPQVPASGDVAADDGISAEERQKITSRIDQIMSENRIQVSPQTLSYTPKRTGAVLPLVTNLAVLVVAAGAALLIYALLNRQETEISSGRAVLQGTENQLIEAVKQDSERRLKEKDQAILAAQGKLAALGTQADKLKSQADAQVKARSDELQQQFDQKVQAERDRLQKAGLTSGAEAERLRQYESAQRQALELQIAAVRRQADSDLAAQQKALASLTTQYQKELDAARQDRMAAQDEAARRQEDLRRKYAQDTAAAQGEAARVNDELARLQADRQKEQLVVDQIYAGYDRVNHSLQSSDYAGALSSLESIRQLFDSADVASLPTIQKRRSVELFLVSSLEELIRNRRTNAAADAATIVQQSTDLRAVSDLVSRGDALSQSGDLDGARAAYLSAIQKIPLVSHGYVRLEQLKPPEIQLPALVSGLRQANVFYQAGNLAGSVEQYREAVKLIVKDEALAKQITDNVMNAGYHLLAADDLASLGKLRSAEEKRQAILARLREIRTQYLAYERLAPRFSGTNPRDDSSLASLLQAKILMLQIASADPVRAKYPGLGRAMQRYFDALEENGRQEGRRAAMEDVNALLDRLAPSTGEADTGSDALAALMNRLETVLAGN